MSEWIKVTDDWEAFLDNVNRKLSVSSIATGFYQIIESGKEKVILKASVGGVGYEAEISREEASKKIEELKSMLKRKGTFLKITKVTPSELFYT
ncbi:MAG: hypothetical protein ACP5M7_09490 [Thermoproteota archaeon]